MRLQKQLSRKYEGKEYAKYVIVIKPKLIEKLGWRDGADLEAKNKGNKLIIEIVAYRIFLFDKNRKRFRSELLIDRDEFLEKAKLSKTRNKEEDIEIEIVPVETKRKGVGTMIYRNITKKEKYFGKREHIENILEEQRNII